MHDQIIAVSTRLSMGLAGGVTGAEILGLQISDISYIIVAACAVISAAVAVLTYLKNRE